MKPESTLNTESPDTDAPEVAAPVDRTALAIRKSVEDVQAQLSEFDKVSAGIGELKKKYTNVVFDLTSTKGQKDATDARQAIRQPRYAVEAARKAAKAPILALGKDIDARASYITEQLMELETPITEQMEADKRRREEERLTKQREEEARIQKHTRAIEAIRAHALTAVGVASDAIAQTIETVQAIVIGPEWEEYHTSATQAKTQTLLTLNELLNRAREHEAREAQIEADRKELERRRAEDEERRRQDAERQAEADRQAAAQRAEQEAARQAEVRRQEAELAEQRAQLERAQAAQREADRKAAVARGELDSISNAVAACVGARAAEIRQQLVALNGAVYVSADAGAAHDAAVKRIEALLEGAVQREADEARAAEARAQQAREAQEAQERQRQAAEAAAAEQRRKDAEAAEERRQEAERAEQARAAQRRALAQAEKAGPALLAALQVALPYVMQHGTKAHQKQCNAAITLATKAEEVQA